MNADQRNGSESQCLLSKLYTLISRYLLYSGCSRRLHLKCMCYRGAVEHLGRQQGDLREIENSQMQDCLWLSVQDVPCVQKIRMPSWSTDFLLLPLMLMHTCVCSPTATSATGMLCSRLTCPFIQLPTCLLSISLHFCSFTVVLQWKNDSDATWMWMLMQ